MIKRDDQFDDLTYLRLRTKQNEIIVVPGKQFFVDILFRGMVVINMIKNQSG